MNHGDSINHAWSSAFSEFAIRECSRLIIAFRTPFVAASHHRITSATRTRHIR